MKKFLLSIVLVLLCGAGLFFSGCMESAYEIAVRNGYVGTESQWLESLKGPSGQKGKDGVDYEDLKKIYADLVDSGDFTGSFLDFVKEYLNVYDIGLEQVGNKCMLSSVAVYGYYTYFGKLYYSGGSGVVYKIDKANNLVYFITNYHVVYSDEVMDICEQITVRLYSDESSGGDIECSYVGGSEFYDVAVIVARGAKAQEIIDSGVKAVDVADYFDYTLAETVVAVGNSKAEGIVVTSGILSAIDKDSKYSIAGTAYYHRCLQMDAAINSGNSGGGLFNVAGQLIGIVSSKHSSEQDVDGLNIVEGMCYAIPVNNAISIADYCIQNCDGVLNTTAKAYYYGIKVVGANPSLQIKDSYKTVVVEDVAVQSVDSGSLGALVGLHANDIVKKVKILKASGDVREFEITRDFMLQESLLQAMKGDSIQITISRSGVTHTLTHAFVQLDAQYLYTCETIAASKKI